MADLLKTNCLPRLEELHLCCQEMLSRDVKCLALVLKTAPIGNRLKVLGLYFIHQNGEVEFSPWMKWESTACILGLQQEQDTPILPGLIELYLADIPWHLMGKYLMTGRFPSLIKIQKSRDYDTKSETGRCWYEIDAATVHLWFEVLRFRKQLQPPEEIRFKDIFILDCAKELFLGLSQPINSKMISSVQHIQSLQLDKGLDSGLCESLSLAIRSQTFLSLRSLALEFRETCSAEALSTLGGSVHDAFLPCLVTIILGGGVQEADAWRAFLAAMAVHCPRSLEALYILESLDPMLEALKGSAIVDQVSRLHLMGSSRGYLQGQRLPVLASFFSGGTFSNLQILTVQGKSHKHNLLSSYSVCYENGLNSVFLMQAWEPMPLI